MIRRIGGLALVLFAMAGCQSAPRPSDNISRPGDNSALSTMERIAVASQKCWFGGKNGAFAGLALSPELTSHSGKPRILAVPRGNVGGLPKLVVEATGKPARLNAYGPLMSGAQASQISSDIHRWASGDAACGARA
ncbi:MAG TPA: hypothetical protein VNS02_13735 [Rhizobiaceae bacterium]|nr:hypothetical protein [Rhizobiaceae bacterium]